MGTCISKCCLNSNPPPNSSSNLLAKQNSNSNPDSNPPPPQDKLVISQSSLPTPSPSTSTSASKPSFSSTSTSTGTSSCSSSSTTSKLKPYTNDFLLSCAKENPHIIILDPHKYDAVPKPKKPTLRPTDQCDSVRLPSKSFRPIVRQKSFRPSEARPGINTKPGRASSSPNNAAKSWSRSAERNERPRPLSHCNSLSRIKSKESDKDRPHMVEDVDNPLISMDCFIFL